MKNVHIVHNCSNLHADQNLMAIFSLILALCLGLLPSPNMGHIANADQPRNQYRPEFDGYGPMKDVFIFKEYLLNMVYDNYRMNQIYLVNNSLKYLAVL